MYHVEGRDLPALVAPEQCAVGGILDRVAPDRWIEERYADADHAVAAIALGERVAEDLIQGSDVVEPCQEWPLYLLRGSPRPGGDHQACSADAGSGVSSNRSPPSPGGSTTVPPGQSCSTSDDPLSWS